MFFVRNRTFRFFAKSGNCRGFLRFSVWAYDFPGSNRPKVLKSGKRAEKSARGVNERSGARKACAWRGCAVISGDITKPVPFTEVFSLFRSLCSLRPRPPGRPAGAGRGRPTGRPAGAGRPEPAGRPWPWPWPWPDPWIPASGSMGPSLRIRGSPPPDPWIPASRSMDPGLRIHGSKPPAPWIPASGSSDPSLRILGSQPPDPWNPWIRR